MNVTNLQLATAAARGRELAIRAAIGAGAGRIARQVVVEHVVLGLSGASAGLVLAWGMYRTALHVLPADFPRLEDLGLDAVALGAAAATSIVASLLAALLPAWRLRRLDIAALAREGSSPVGLGVRTALARSRLAIVGVQIAASCVLLVGASLLGRSFLALLHADRGFDAAAVMSAAVPMAGAEYTPERRVAILQQVVDRLRVWPGVESAAFTSESPATPGGSTSSLTLPAREGGGPVRVQASPRLVSAGYFETLGLRVLTGRTLRDTDTATSQPVAVVNETFARRYLGAAPLDARIPMGVWGSSGAAAADAAIVGVVEDVRYVDTVVTTLPEMYFPSRQIPVGMRSTIGTLLVRGDRLDAPLAAGVRAAIREIDPTIVPMAVMTLEDRLLATSLARPRLYATLLGLFASVAIAVAGVGLFGVLSYVVAQRTRELALRSALGASRTALVWLVLRQATGVAAAGIAGGLLLSLWLTRGLAALLHGITAGDPTTYALVPVLLLLIVCAACLAPARRIARVDPLHALRSEPRF
jgi:predicted permease